MTKQFGYMESDGYWANDTIQIRRKLANSGQNRIRYYSQEKMTWSSLQRFMRVVIDSGKFEISSYAEMGTKFHEFKRKS